MVEGKLHPIIGNDEQCRGSRLGSMRWTDSGKGVGHPISDCRLERQGDPRSVSYYYEHESSPYDSYHF